MQLNVCDGLLQNVRQGLNQNCLTTGNLIDTIEIVSSITGQGQVVGPVTSVTFGQTGDGKKQARLSDTKRYMITGLWKRNISTGVDLHIRPNNDSTNVRHSRMRSIDGSTPPTGDAQDNLLIGDYDATFDADAQTSFRVWLDPRITGLSRPWYGWFSIVDETPDGALWVLGGGWTDVSTALESMTIIATVADEIDVGSRFELYEEIVTL